MYLKYLVGLVFPALLYHINPIECPCAVEVYKGGDMILSLIIIIGFFINVQVQGPYPQQCPPPPLPGNWLAARMADLTPDLQVSQSWGSIAESFHSLRSLSVRCFQVILGLPGPRFPSTCISKAVLTAPLERSTCPYQRSLLSFSMRSRSSVLSRASSSVDLMVAVSCGLTLQICLIIALSFRCRHWRLGFAGGWA